MAVFRKKTPFKVWTIIILSELAARAVAIKVVLSLLYHIGLIITLLEINGTKLNKNHQKDLNVTKLTRPTICYASQYKKKQLYHYSALPLPSSIITQLYHHPALLLTSPPLPSPTITQLYHEPI